MYKEIGGDFWLDTAKVKDDLNTTEIKMSAFGIYGKESVFLSSGRAAILFAIKDIKKVKNKSASLKAMIPSYTCETVVQPFLDENIFVSTYSITDKLDINKEEFENQLEYLKPDIVLIHRYFGFDTANNIQEIINCHRKEGCAFIEDRTQNIFSQFAGLQVDYVVGSFRKWAAIPDGGFCVKVGETFEYQCDCLNEDEKMIDCKLNAFHQKKEYMCKNIGDKNTFLKTYKEAEEMLDKERAFFSMSCFSKRIIECLDIEQLGNQRRKNYKYVFNNINNSSISIVTGELDFDVVPLYLVIRCSRRNILQQELKIHNIYAPIVWPKPDMMSELHPTTKEIYKKVLCLPIDQRYRLDDMTRMVKVINSFG